MYMYHGFTLLYNRNQHNIVKQLDSNKNEYNFFKVLKTVMMVVHHCGWT